MTTTITGFAAGPVPLSVIVLDAEGKPKAGYTIENVGGSNGTLGVSLGKGERAIFQEVHPPEETPAPTAPPAEG